MSESTNRPGDDLIGKYIAALRATRSQVLMLQSGREASSGLEQVMDTAFLGGYASTFIESDLPHLLDFLERANQLAGELSRRRRTRPAARQLRGLLNELVIQHAISATALEEDLPT